MVNRGSMLNGKPLIMKWYTPKPTPITPTLPTVKTSNLASLPLPHHLPVADVSKPTSLDITSRRTVVEKQTSIDDQVRISVEDVRHP